MFVCIIFTCRICAFDLVGSGSRLYRGNMRVNACLNIRLAHQAGSQSFPPSVFPLFFQDLINIPQLLQRIVCMHPNTRTPKSVSQNMHLCAYVATHTHTHTHSMLHYSFSSSKFKQDACYVHGLLLCRRSLSFALTSAPCLLCVLSDLKEAKVQVHKLRPKHVQNVAFKSFSWRNRNWEGMI